MISNTSCARLVLLLKVKAFKEQEELQARLEKQKRKTIQIEIADLHEEIASNARIADIEREIAKASSS